MAGVVVLDASVLIAFFESSDPFHGRAIEIVTTAIGQGADLIANELTVAEFLVGPARSGIVASAEAGLSQLGIGRRGFPTSFASRLATIRHRARVKLPDAAVILTAVDAAEAGTGAVSVATFDARLRAGAATYGITAAIED
ncbi:type II toxin-antitoxin system VapC family toxin [Tsukamurella tyrosinosolvens]|uniref:type II toxin-antitoxin system VapC family toxin n=1 Tax=Tsukamurella tyrosinosolvens TaxID=57704 RepID=UPI000DF68870|nr:PIN domain-containing protein [Tsukamurella tyrosinosolvens]RDB45711.1 type II toxin-antitoxin system VapC family toxin [Tsukamurella tyrosinosolvens]